MKATNNNKLVPRPSIILLMRALFASPRTKCSIANTICLLAIAIATILAMEPEMILMDEPSTALDPVNRRTVINTINRLSQTKLIASHDLDMILDTCQRVILLSHGTIIADGDAETILRDKVLLENNRMELPFCLQGWKKHE